MIRIVKPFEAIMCFIMCVVLLLLAFNVQVAQATQVRYHDLGDFKFLHDTREGRSPGRRPMEQAMATGRLLER